MLCIFIVVVTSEFIIHDPTFSSSAERLTTSSHLPYNNGRSVKRRYHVMVR